ncbi:hypothetical protein HBI81_192440 [Parastagonospora nodorum]|nr:hypothetical protein HBI09_187260 [Parastagonospora nodorum]KAH4994424.1 hypothetical protein HBI77_208670 [Parastagonospora nodorum]KAH6516305.1 hypothetical protein HBI81_192440 [Parastagonospora nodorum]
MATAEVLSPSLAADAADAFGKSNVFTYQVPIQVNAVVPDAGTSAPSAVNKEYFLLNTKAFIDLQLYLKAALRLPGTIDRFDLEFPRKMFENYKDTKTPVLYDLMCRTLVDIQNHCFDFQNNTLGPMVSLAGYIGNYAETAGKRSVELLAAMNVIQDGASNLEDPKVKEAVETAMIICLELSDEARQSNEKCAAFVKQLGTFKTITGIDKERLNTLNERQSIVLPSTAQLNTDLRKSMDTARDELNSLAIQENKQREKAKANSGVRWYYAVPWIGWGLAISETVKKADAENAVRSLQKKYEEVANKAGNDLATAISFREKCKNLTELIKDVHQYIQQAESALTSMAGAFSALETDLNLIANKLDTVKKYVSSGSNVRTKLAFSRLNEAGDKWIKVASLAKDFQRNGLMMDANVRAEDPPATPSPSLDITSAHYGGIESTAVAKILFNEGENLRVHSVAPGFQEPWHGVNKTISFMYDFGKEKRIFVCREYSGDHDVKVGPMENSRDGRCEVSVVEPRPKPAGSPVDILAIIWGPNEVRRPAVDAYCYQQFHAGAAIEWTNDKMGGDTWPGMPKSGAIYYTTKGGSAVKSICGKEGSSSGTA